MSNISVKDIPPSVNKPLRDKYGRYTKQVQQKSVFVTLTVPPALIGATSISAPNGSGTGIPLYGSTTNSGGVGYTTDFTNFPPAEVMPSSVSIPAVELVAKSVEPAVIEKAPIVKVKFEDYQQTLLRLNLQSYNKDKKSLYSQKIASNNTFTLAPLKFTSLVGKYVKSGICDNCFFDANTLPEEYYDEKTNTWNLPPDFRIFTINEQGNPSYPHPPTIDLEGHKIVHALIESRVDDILTYLTKKSYSSPEKDFKSIKPSGKFKFNRGVFTHPLTLVVSYFNHPQLYQYYEFLQKNWLNSPSLVTKVNEAKVLLDEARSVGIPADKQYDEFSLKEQKEFLSKLTARTGFTYDFPCLENLQKFTPESDIWKQVEEHCSHIPGFKIEFLGLRRICYRSDGPQSKTPDTINTKGYHILTNPNNLVQGSQKAYVSKTKKTAKDSINDLNGIYCGDAYVLYFTQHKVDILMQNLVYFFTPEQYKEGISQSRPDLAIDAWSALQFCSSNACERNGDKNYGKFYDLQTPVQKQLSLASWILGPCTEKAIKSGITIPNSKMFAPSLHRDRYNKIQKELEEWAKEQEALKKPAMVIAQASKQSEAAKKGWATRKGIPYVAPSLVIAETGTPQVIVQKDQLIAIDEELLKAFEDDEELGDDDPFGVD